MTESPPVQAGRGTLSTRKIVYFVVAAAAPLAAMISTVPLAFALGTGPGTPVAFIVAALVLLCFSAGYAAMSRRIVNTGAFYTYIRAGLGRAPGAAAAYLAVLSYNAIMIGLVGAFAYFARLVVQQQLSVTIGWPWFALVTLVIVAVLGRRQVDVSARVLRWLMLAEFTILLILDIAVLGQKGFRAFPVTSFEPKVAFGAGLGLTLSYAFISFTGFESAALYGEEARDPKRAVPRATYLAVSVIAVFYGVTSWIAVGAVGPGELRGTATKELGNLFFAINTQYTTSWLTTVMSVMLCTSFLASAIAAHNAVSRYMYALGREGLLPRRLGTLHPRHDSPHLASAAQVGVTAVVVAAYALAGLDPYLNLSTSIIGLGTVGWIVMLLWTAVAIFVYFARHNSERHWWNTVVAPLLAVAGLGTVTVLILQNYAYLTGTHSTVVNNLPWLLVVAVAAGLVRSLWLPEPVAESLEEESVSAGTA